MKQEKVWFMGHSEFEALVDKTYHQEQEYSMSMDLEVSNDSWYAVMGVEKEATPDPDEVAAIQEWVEGDVGATLITRRLVQDMVNNGVLAPGSYLFSISW